MSKNTKIIAIAGGVLILAFILMSAFTKGGCSGAIDVWKGMLGCQANKKATKKKGNSRDFCVQHPEDSRCTKSAGMNAAKDDEGDDEGDDMAAAAAMAAPAMAAPAMAAPAMGAPAMGAPAMGAPPMAPAMGADN